MPIIENKAKAKINMLLLHAQHVAYFVQWNSAHNIWQATLFY